jgi:predicted enzyme related to lactoylglutathione lyase
MDEKKKSLFRNVDCIQFYVPNLEEGINYYCKSMGLRLIWKSNSSVGLGMDEDITEVVLQNERKGLEIDFKVESVADAIDEIRKAGGEVIFGPFDIQIGKCAVIRDPWGNPYVILDMSKGTFITDEEGNITGQNKSED